MLSGLHQDGGGQVCSNVIGVSAIDKESLPIRSGWGCARAGKALGKKALKKCNLKPSINR